MSLSSIASIIHTLLITFGNLMHGGTLPNLGNWDYLLLALLSAVQGPVATLLGSAAASTGIVRPEIVFFSISTGNLTCDMLWYTLGRVGKIDWLLGSHRLFRVPRSRVEDLRSIVVDQSSRVMTLAKLTSGFVLPTMIATGLARVPWKRWLPSLFLVEVGRTGLLVLVGYYSARALSQVLQGYSYIAIFGSVSMLLVSGWIIYRTLHLKEKF